MYTCYIYTYTYIYIYIYICVCVCVCVCDDIVDLLGYIYMHQNISVKLVGFNIW